MLYILKQYKNLFVGLTMSYVESGPKTNAGLEQKEMTDEMKNQILLQNKDLINQFNPLAEGNDASKVEALKTDSKQLKKLQSLFRHIGMVNTVGDKIGQPISSDGIWGKNTENALNTCIQVLSGSKDLKEIQNETVSEKEILKQDIFSDSERVVAKFEIRQDTGNKDLVKELQNALILLGYKLKGKNNGVDGKFGGSTSRAFKDAESKLNAKIKLERTSGLQSGLDTKVDSTTNDQEVMDKIDQTTDTVENLKNKLIVTHELNAKLEKYLFKESKGYSIEALLEETFDKDKYSEIITSKNEYTNLLKAGGKAKLERATAYLINYKESDGHDFEKNRFEKIASETGKVLPWLLGIYLGDIPLPFIEELTQGAQIGKSVAYKDWIKNGMKGEFDDYYRANEKDSNVLKSQQGLMSMLSSLDLSKTEKDDIIAGKLDNLNQETLELIRTYIAVRLLPDLKILQDHAYNPFEKGSIWTLGGLFGLFKDNKYSKGNEAIAEIEEMLKAGETDLKIADRVIALLKEEGQHLNAISYTENRQDHFQKVDAMNKKFDTIGDLIEAGFGDFLSVFYFQNISDLKSLGVTESDKRSIDKLAKILAKKPIEGKEVKAFMDNNPSTMRFIKALNDREQMASYLEGQIPVSSKLEYKNGGAAKHMSSLAGMTNQEALQHATTTTTEKGGKISSLGLAYKSLLEKGAALGISYEEYENAFANKTNISVEELSDELKNTPIFNTGRKSGQETITTINDLVERYGDTEVYKLQDVVKTYAFYNAEGQLVTQQVTYNLYMRPDCGNPLIVPGKSVKTVTVQETPYFDPRTVTEVDGKLPLVIPYSLMIGSASGDGGIGTTPGIEEGSNGGGNGVPVVITGTR